MIKSIFKILYTIIFIIIFPSISFPKDLAIVGTGDGLELLQALAAEFTEQHPHITVSTPPSIGSSGGVVAVLAQLERLGRVTRPLKKTEEDQDLKYIPIAKIPTAIYTNHSTSVTELTSEELRRIFSGEAKNWIEFGGTDQKIKVVRREDSDSTLQSLRDAMPGWKDIELTAHSKVALTTQDSIQTVRDVEGAVGFGSFSREAFNTTSVLKIDGHMPTDNDYPSAVTLALIFKKDHGEDPDIRLFLNFVKSDNAAKTVRNHGGAPIKD